MAGRYTELSSGTQASDDFKVRRRPLLVPLTVVVGTAFVALYLAGLGLQDGEGHLLYAATLLVILMALGIFTAIFTQRQRDLVLLTEFQNTLFASAARMNSQFCLILKRDGTVVYVDPGFQQLFPQISHRDLRDVSLLGQWGILAPEHQQAFDSALLEQRPETRILDLPLPGGLQLKSVLTLEPLPRPRGYFLLRSRPFVDRQHIATHATPPPALPATLPNAAQNASLEELIDNSPIAIASVDTDGRVMRCNESFRKLTDRTRHRHPGWDFFEVIAPAQREEVREKIRQPAVLQGAPLEIRIGGEQEKAAALYLSTLASGEIILHLIDTTEQKNLELRYAHSQKMQAVGQLAGGVAHDFNNLLTAMIGFCDLLLMRHPAGDQSFADIMQVKQNANRAANLVRQLLAFSRRQTLQPKLLDLTEVLAELSNLVRRLIGENIELKMVHGRDIGMVRADQGQLEQVLINLAVNARDAMGQGGVLTLRTSTLSVKSRYDLDPSLIAPSEDDAIAPGDYVRVELSDTGMGIPPENIQKIFEPFFSTKEVGAGTGLGLATVYGIVKQTGGYIYVASAPGVGTQFHLFFPRFEAQAAEIAAEKTEEHERIGDLTGTGTILLVEDEAPVRSFAARALRNKGYNVLEADCGEAALEVVREHGGEIDLIVSDVIMPGMNGPEMVKQVMPLHPNIRVIFISGYAEDAFSDSFGENFQINFLPKPFTLKQLAGKVKDTLK